MPPPFEEKYKIQIDLEDVELMSGVYTPECSPALIQNPHGK